VVLPWSTWAMMARLRKSSRIFIKSPIMALNRQGAA
jgi:hypothetical protein